MKPLYADLHCHSTCSDGSATPQELVQIAASKGLKALAITDHDNIEAYAEALPHAKQAGITLISGVEFSSQHSHKSVHILGYGIDCQHKELLEFCQQHQMRRLKRGMQTLQLLAKYDMPISEEELLCQFNLSKSSKSLGRPHIAQAMVKKGYVASVQEAFHKYLGDSRPCHIAVESFSTEVTIETIHKANGLAIIAHPHLIKDAKLLLELLKMPFDGLECYYGTFPPANHQRWLKIAKRKNWLVTGGSDFHGQVKPTVSLGANGLDEDNFNILLARINVAHESLRRCTK